MMQLKSKVTYQVGDSMFQHLTQLVLVMFIGLSSIIQLADSCKKNRHFPFFLIFWA